MEAARSVSMLKPDSRIKPRISRPISSTVRAGCVAMRQWSSSCPLSKRPTTVSVLPTSKTRIMAHTWKELADRILGASGSGNSADQSNGPAANLLDTFRRAKQESPFPADSYRLSGATSVDFDGATEQCIMGAQFSHFRLIQGLRDARLCFQQSAREGSGDLRQSDSMTRL